MAYFYGIVKLILMRLFTILLTLILSSTLLGQDIVINEVLSSNSKTVRDPIGDFDDYVELYNRSNQAVDVSKYLLTDEKDSLFKCILPAGTRIPAKGYLMVWADAEMDQEGIHCPFKLSSKGERVILSDRDINKLDEVNLKRQYEDVSFGRYPSGGDTWRYMNPSPSKANLNSRVLAVDRKDKDDKVKIKVKVDESKQALNVKVDSPKMAYRLTDKDERILLKGQIEQGEGKVSLSSLETGKYRFLIGKSVYRVLLVK